MTLGFLFASPPREFLIGDGFIAKAEDARTLREIMEHSHISFLFLGVADANRNKTFIP